jgi:hypothetical protein
MRYASLFTVLLFLASSINAQITLPNGHIVPKDSFIVYLFFGHSNMAGRDKGNLDSAANPFLWNFQLDRQPLQTWVPAKEPIHIENPPFPEFGCGPGMPFLRAMSNAYPGYYFGIIQNANSHYTIAVDYRRGKAAYIEEIGAAQTLMGKVTFGAMVAMLGWVESEGEIAAASPLEFAWQETSMVAEIRQDLQVPNLPYLVGEFENGASSTRAIYRDTVARRILLTPSLIKNSAIVPSAGMGYIDDHHFDCVSQKAWAQRAFRICVDSGWVPGGGSPVAVPARFGPGSGLALSRGDALLVFDARGRLISSQAVQAAGVMPHFGLRGVYFVKHLRGGTVISTTRKILF